MRAYTAADVVVQPAREDDLPYTVVEVWACGTSVVGFPIGGTFDLFRDQDTGWFADYVEPRALAATLGRARDALASRLNLRAACRHVIEGKYDVQRQARRCAALFQTRV